VIEIENKMSQQPVSRIRDPGSRVDNIPDPKSASNNLSIFNPKTVYKFSKIRSGMFIPDPDCGFFPLPEARNKKSTGSRIRIRNTARIRRLNLAVRKVSST
jgi:hypothetical protein